MALEAEDLINNAKSDLSQAVALLLKRRNHYFERQQVAKYRQTNCQISEIRSALKALDENSKEAVLPTIAKRFPHPAQRSNKVFT